MTPTEHREGLRKLILKAAYEFADAGPATSAANRDALLGLCDELEANAARAQTIFASVLEQTSRATEEAYLDHLVFGAPLDAEAAASKATLDGPKSAIDRSHGCLAENCQERAVTNSPFCQKHELEYRRRAIMGSGLF